MTIGRTTENKIKIKTDGGLRAVDGTIQWIATESC
jgi:hypothetical protein